MPSHSQVIIVQFGGIAFFTVPLTMEQWFWCVFFGISELLFGQVSVHYKVSQYYLDSRTVKWCIVEMVRTNRLIV